MTIKCDLDVFILLSFFIVIAFIKMLFLQITQKFPVEIYLRQNLSL